MGIQGPCLQQLCRCPRKDPGKAGVLTSKQGLGLPDCRLQLLWGHDLAWKWLCCPFHPEGKWTREMTLLPELTPYLAHGFLPLLCKS